MNRANWRMQATSQSIVVAANSKAAIHNSKKDWWKKTYDEVMSEAKEKGIEVIESSAANYGNNTSMAFGPRIGISEEYQLKLTEADGKVKFHDSQVKLFNSWIKMLSDPAAMSRYDLDVDDYQFFFGE